jgi:hypothetical protein
MDNNENSKRIDLLKWFINTVVIGLLTFFFTWVLNERKQGVEEIKVYNTYVELVTKVDGLAERRLLAEFFSNVTVSNKLKEGWENYYDILDEQYKIELAKQDSIINKIDSSTIKGKVELENALLVKNKIKNTGLTSPIIPTKNISSNNYELALKNELEGFNYLLEKNIEDAISAFSRSENAYNSFHQVYEIAKYLKDKKDLIRDDKFWQRTYRDLIENYSWKMPDSIKSEFEKRTKN